MSISHIYTQYFSTPIGEFIQGSFEGRLCLLDYRYRKQRISVDERIRSGLKTAYHEQDTPLLADCRTQVSEYLAGRREEFDIPFLMVGSEFQQKVWKALGEIPYGRTTTYLELSRRLGDEKAIRAVAAANGANALALLIPCHRVVGSKGELVGYAGGLPAKKKLLELENPAFNPQLEMKF